jgi:hypothetical protein
MLTEAIIPTSISNGKFLRFYLTVGSTVPPKAVQRSLYGIESGVRLEHSKRSADKSLHKSNYFSCRRGSPIYDKGGRE